MDDVGVGGVGWFGESAVLAEPAELWSALEGGCWGGVEGFAVGGVGVDAGRCCGCGCAYFDEGEVVVGGWCEGGCSAGGCVDGVDPVVVRVPRVTRVGVRSSTRPPHVPISVRPSSRSTRGGRSSRRLVVGSRRAWSPTTPGRRAVVRATVPQASTADEHRHAAARKHHIDRASWHSGHREVHPETLAGGER